MKKSRVTFEIDSSKVPTVAALIIDQVSDFHVTEVAQPVTLGRQRSQSMVWAEGAADEISSYLKANSSRDFFYKDLACLAVKHGLKDTSVTPVISALVKAGNIKRTRRGHYQWNGHE